MFEFRVSVPFVPRRPHVELLRSALLNCLTSMFHAHDFCEQLAMVAAELLENAIHYGQQGPERECAFWLEVIGDPEQISVEVRNPGSLEGEDLRRLQCTLATLARAGARAAYVRKLQDVAADPDLAGSRLGLLRIAFETGCDLSASVTSDGVVSVRAVVRAHDRWPSSVAES